MAIQSYVGAEINPDINTFESWLNMTNSIITDMGSVVITTGNNNIGNTAISGTFGAGVVSVEGSLRGGTLTTSNTLLITSNTNFTGGVITTSPTTAIQTAGNVTFTGGTRTFVVETASMTVSTVNMTVNANTIFNGTVNFSANVTANNVTIDGTLTANSLNFSGITSLESLTVTGNTNLNNLVVSSNSDFTNIFAQNITASANTVTTRLTVTANTTLANTTISNLTISGNMTSNTVSSNTATITTLTANTGTLTTFTANTGTITNLTSSNSTISSLVVSGSGAMRLPVGATVQRPTSPTSGLIRYNSTINKFEGYGESAWETISDSIGTVSGTGYIIKTSSGTITRSITAGSGIVIANPNGVSDSTSISADFASNSEIHSGASNKSISSSNLYTSSAAVIQAIGTSSFTINLNTGRNFLVDLTGNRTINNPTNQKPGQKGMIIVRQDSAGGRVLTFPSDSHFKFSGGVSALSTVANSIDVISYYVLETGTILCTITRGF
jgi:trimeric autotransporter adhesin